MGSGTTSLEATMHTVWTLDIFTGKAIEGNLRQNQFENSGKS